MGPPPPPGRGFRRGEFLPRAFEGGQVLNPRQYRLRTPPPGYVWYGVGRNAYLVQRSSGMILDTAPAAW
jgi:Ni/Co efflux regulator RcnB